jgi:hypothetical protein
MDQQLLEFRYSLTAVAASVVKARWVIRSEISLACWGCMIVNDRQFKGELANGSQETTSQSVSQKQSRFK